jgi:hypothetical protein
LELHRVAPCSRPLLCVASHFLAVTFSRKCLFGPALVSGLQIEGMFLDILDDILLLHLPFESSKSALDRFTILYLDFRHA